MFAHDESDTSKLRRTTSAALYRALGLLRARALTVRARRRLGWFTRGLTPRKLLNMLLAGAEFAAKREKLHSWPVFLRIDISPLCNLRCTICVHAEPDGNPALGKQRFHKSQRMTVEQFTRIIDEVKDRSMGVSLYYLGDPLVHPDLDEMCTIASQAGLNVHYSTNLSFQLSDARIESMVTSGVTHLTACVDGLSQAKYELTRIGGRIDTVLSNLRRLCACRARLRRRDPLIEVQYIKYQHNLDEVEPARQTLTDMGVDQFHELWGGLHNYTDRDPATTPCSARRRTACCRSAIGRISSCRSSMTAA